MTQKLSDNNTWSFNTLNQRTKHSGFTKKKRRAYEHYQKCTSIANLSFLKSHLEGFVINFCCGCDPNGDVKVDIDKKILKVQKLSTLDKADYMIADIHYLPFQEKCCDSIICDPPFSLYCKFKWALNLAKLARKKVILSHPGTNLKIHGFKRELFFINSKSIFLRLWWVFTNKETLV